MKRRLGLVLLATLALGCGKTVTEEDCKKIGAKMHEVWLAEAKSAAPAEGPLSEKASSVIKGEGDRLDTDWAVECKKELMGRRVDPKEMDCLLKAKSIAEVNKCAEL
jgi:hypothetical protein